MLYIDKDHNQPRKIDELVEIFQFVRNKLGVPKTAPKKKVDSLIQRHFQFI